MSRILIVGGGFAGFWAAMAAKRVAGDKAEVSLVSRTPVLEIRPRLYEANPETLGIDLRAPLAAASIRFVEGEATGLDLAAHKVKLASGDLPYDRLVVAAGSAMRRPPVPGADQAFSIDTQAEAIRLDRRLALGVASVAVVGAGFTGIELALELRDRIAAHGGDGERLRIVLIDRASAVGTELGVGPRPTIEAALAAARVELRLGATIASLGPDRVGFANDDTLAVDAVVLTTGMAASGFVRHVPGERDRLSRLKVERSLRAPQAPDVFVTGDAAAADTGSGNLALQSCQHALQLGRFAGENAARDLLGQPLIDYAQPCYVTCLDLGRAGAVFTEGWTRAVQKSGEEAKAIKRRINTQVIYPPSGASGALLLAMSSTEPAKQARPS